MRKQLCVYTWALPVS